MIRQSICQICIAFTLGSKYHVAVSVAKRNLFLFELSDVGCGAAAPKAGLGSASSVLLVKVCYPV